MLGDAEIDRAVQFGRESAHAMVFREGAASIAETTKRMANEFYEIGAAVRRTGESIGSLARHIVMAQRGEIW